MITKKEVLSIFLAAIILGYIESFTKFTWINWLIFSGMGLAIVGVHVLGQKICATVFDSDTETSIWKMERFWFPQSRYFKTPIPTGLLIPLSALFISFGYFKFMTLITFEASPLPHKIKPFSKITEYQLAIIALSGSIANMVIAFFSFLFGFNEFAMLNIYFAFFSLIPFSTLDGTKVFFGSRLLWLFSFSFVLALIILFEVAGLWPTIISAVIIALAIMVAYFFSFEA
ncbi:MAG: hypothetical protein KKE23_00420 [Nanoarchaeota archaeon]|nr:hypothetical protein [Nanoarchaeota archaeon]